MTHDPEMARLRWRCRRGMRELDMLLLRYADGYYPEAGESERRAFRRLLSAPDPDILALLTGKARADDDALKHVIECLLERH